MNVRAYNYLRECSYDSKNINRATSIYINIQRCYFTTSWGMCT